ncbi:MAG: diguanylate cyclase domain-containing protein [Faecalibacillus faecis]
MSHFKEVNDTYGHLSGNELLISLAKYLLFYTNQDDIVIRMVEMNLLSCENIQMI